MTSVAENYRFEQEGRLLRQHKKMVGLGESLLVERYGRSAADEIIAQSLVEFKQILPEIPYIGGKANSMTETIEQMGTILAIYRTLKGRERPVEEIGELVYRMSEAWIDQYPEFVRRFVGRFYMSRFQRRRSEKNALISQHRQYAGNFVTEVVDGEGEDFEWGINYLECGVVKYFAQEGAEELTPYMCQIDYLFFAGLGSNLQRQRTITGASIRAMPAARWPSASRPGWSGCGSSW
jgi:hypothetical protein